MLKVSRTPSTGHSRLTVALLTLLGHLMSCVGVPLFFAADPTAKLAGVPYPCQFRPCGCLSAAECWQGDCCCFTLEEKLLWAEERGFEPPSHVRPLVESRKSRGTPPRKRSSCCESEQKSQAGGPTLTCCETQENGSFPIDAQNCVECQTKSESASQLGSVRWVIGVFAQKCRGNDPSGTITTKPALPLEPILSIESPAVTGVAELIQQIDFLALTSTPPTPPPKSL